MAEVDRQSLLAFTLLSAIRSNNTSETMDKELSKHLNFKTSEIMLNDLSSASGLNKEHIKILLKFNFR